MSSELRNCGWCSACNDDVAAECEILAICGGTDQRDALFRIAIEMCTTDETNKALIGDKIEILREIVSSDSAQLLAAVKHAITTDQASVEHAKKTREDQRQVQANLKMIKSLKKPYRIAVSADGYTFDVAPWAVTDSEEAIDEFVEWVDTNLFTCWHDDYQWINMTTHTSPDVLIENLERRAKPEWLECITLPLDAKKRKIVK
jgi:hypothetical protein